MQFHDISRSQILNKFYLKFFGRISGIFFVIQIPVTFDSNPRKSEHLAIIKSIRSNFIVKFCIKPQKQNGQVKLLDQQS